MQVTRRQVSIALYTLLKNCYPWKFSEPTARIWDKVQPTQQPYLGLYKPAEDDDQPMAWGLQRYKLMYSALVYARRPDYPTSTPGEFGYMLDDIQDAIDSAMLGPRPGEQQNLGLSPGLQAMVVGRIDRDEGIIDQQGKMEIPIQVLIGI